MPNRLVQAARRRPRRSAAALVACVAGVAALAVGGLALAKSFTLNVTNNVHVTNAKFKSFAVKAVNTHEAVAVGSAGFAVYTFQGETTHHLICTSTGKNGCLGFWPPVQVMSAKGIGLAPGITGKLGTFNRKHVGLQLTLNGQPLYYFTPDILAKNKHLAQGDELKTFGSIWHIVKASAGSHAAQPSPSPTMSTTSTTSTNPYPNGWG